MNFRISFSKGDFKAYVPEIVHFMFIANPLFMSLHVLHAKACIVILTFSFWGGGRHKTLEQRSRYKMSFTRYHFKVGCLVDEGLFKLIVGSVKLGIFFCSGKRG